VSDTQVMCMTKAFIRIRSLININYWIFIFNVKSRFAVSYVIILIVVTVLGAHFQFSLFFIFYMVFMFLYA